MDIIDLSVKQLSENINKHNSQPLQFAFKSLYIYFKLTYRAVEALRPPHIHSSDYQPKICAT